MSSVRGVDSVEAELGYAAGSSGRGVVYTRLHARGIRHLLRIAFAVRPTLANDERAVGYAAVTVAAKALRERGFRHVRFALGDSRLVDEMTAHRELPDTLAMAYVQVRCALNALASFKVRVRQADELTQRARAEVALNVAA